MLWTKCDTLISNSSGNPLNCKNCPCGYYALFAFKRFPVNRQTGEADFCRPGVWVEPFEVINNKINGGDYCRRCYEINRTPDEDGLVGYSKGCFCCWEDCWDWRENPETGEWYCAEMGEYCDDCSEVRVYRLSPCFNKYEDFAAWFYSGCGTEPDEQGKYPDIFQEWYGQKYMTGAAQNCVNNYWQGIAEEKYNTYCKMTFETRTFGFNIYPHSSKDVTNTVCHDWCDGDCREYDANYNCTDCDGAMMHECYEEYDHTEYLAMWVQEYDTYYNIGGYAWWEPNCWYNTGCWMFEGPACCEYWSGATSALDAINQFDATKKQDLEGMDIGTTDEITFPNGYRWCWDKYYEAYHGTWNNVHYWHSVRWGRMIFKRDDRTPSGATGVKIRLTAYTYKTNNPSDNLENDIKTYIYEKAEIDMKFGEKLDFPLVDNMKPYYFSDTVENNCDSDCERGHYPFMVPEGWHTVSEYLQMDFAIMGYIY